jgi:transposase
MRFVTGQDRNQSTLFPELLDDYVGDDNPVRAIDVFVDELGLGDLGFDGVQPHATGRPSYHPATLLKLYVYGYLNRVQSSRRLERECQRNIELIWLTGRLAPDFKTIADFRKDNGEAIRKVCREFLVRDPVQVLTAHENGIENVVAFLTENVTAQQLEQLAALMDERKCENVEMF